MDISKLYCMEEDAFAQRMNTIDFQRETIGTSMIVDQNYEMSQDYVTGNLRHQLEGYILSNLVAEKEIEVEIPINLMELCTQMWMKKQPLKIKVKVSAKDIIIDPPKMEGRTLRMYNFGEPKINSRLPK